MKNALSCYFIEFFSYLPDNFTTKVAYKYLSRDMGFPTIWYVRPAKAMNSMNLKLLTEHYFEFLSLKGESSESTLFKMPHCWRSHVAAHLQRSQQISSRKPGTFSDTGQESWRNTSNSHKAYIWIVICYIFHPCFASLLLFMLMTLSQL